MQSCFFSNPKGGVCECSGSNIKKGYFQLRANLRTWYKPWWNKWRNGSFSSSLERSNFNAFWFSSFFGLNFKNNPITYDIWKISYITSKTPLHEDIISIASGVTSHYIVLHPVSSRASRTSSILARSVYSPFVAYRLSQYLTQFNFSHWRYFGSFKSIHLLCILISTHQLHFLTTEIASILRPCFDLVNYSLSSVGGLLVSSLVWNTANWIFNWDNR